MLNRIIAYSLRNRVLVAVVALLIAGVGLVAADRLPVDVLPDLNRPTVTVITEAHGLVPEDVERFVTRYIEQSLNGATGVLRVRSSSGMGLSVVYVEFDWGTDIYLNRQIVQEKLQLASVHLPPDIVPHMAPISRLMGQILQVGVRSRTGETDVTEIRALVDQALKLRLLSISGVAQVVSSGGAPRQLQVIISADKLRAHDVTLEEVAESIQHANLSGSGGFLNIGPKGPLVTVTGLVQEEVDLSRAVVRHDPVRPVLELLPSVPEELDRLVTALLAKDPARRPSSAESVAELLEALAQRHGWQWAPIFDEPPSEVTFDELRVSRLVPTAMVVTHDLRERDSDTRPVG